MDYDVAVTGSGLGGSVAALRLSEKGYRMVVLEQGPDIINSFKKPSKKAEKIS